MHAWEGYCGTNFHENVKLKMGAKGGRKEVEKYLYVIPRDVKCSKFTQS